MSQPIPTATLIRGTEIPIGDGVNQPFRALVKIGMESPFSAIVKRIPKSGVVAECYAAILLQGWRVPVPAPILVIDGDDLLYGSTEEYPSLKQRLSIRDDLPAETKHALISIAADIVSTFAETPHAIVADEAIANWDRNLGNILWDGGQPSFIDHEQAFGLGRLGNVNKLATLVCMAGNKNGISSSAVTAALTLPPASKIEFPEGLDLDASAFSAYVSVRIPHLAASVLKRFPSPVDLLSQIPP